MVLKNIPEVFGKHLTKEIGAPLDYSKNKESGNFADSYDLRIPKSSNDDFDEGDLAGALDDMALSAHGDEGKQTDQGHKRSYVSTGNLVSASKIGQELPAEAYMPIKALN